MLENRPKLNIKSCYCCPSCGICDFNHMENLMVPSTFENDTNVYNKPSEHSRKKWMTKLLERKRVLHDDNYIDTIVYDFFDVVKTMISKGLIKGQNVLRYDYFLIRLASRRSIQFDKNKLRDLVPGKIKKDNALFGIIYPSLKWNTDDCIYYKDWKKNQEMITSSVT